MAKKKPLTYQDLAAEYDASHPGSRKAQTRPMALVVKWAECRPDKFHIDEHGYIYHRGK